MRAIVLALVVVVAVNAKPQGALDILEPVLSGLGQKACFPEGVKCFGGSLSVGSATNGVQCCAGLECGGDIVATDAVKTCVKAKVTKQLLPGTCLPSGSTCDNIIFTTGKRALISPCCSGTCQPVVATDTVGKCL